MAGLKDIGIRRLLPKHIDYSKSIPQLKVTGSFTVGQFNTTGSIEFDYTSPVTHNHLKRSAINIAASNNDVSIFRVTNSKPISAVSNFGFNLFYSGSGTGDNNRLVLMTDNQTAGTQVESLYINQTGDVYFGNGNIIIDSSTGDLYLKDQAKLVFDYDVTNTYIAASSGGTEDLEIHADDDIWLMPDDDVNIAAGSTGYATFNGGSKLLLLQSDTDAEYVALQLWNESDAADTTGKVSMQFWLEDSSGTAIDSGKILVAKEQTFTSTTSTQDSKMEFHTSLDGTMSEKMTLSSAGNLSVDGTLTCATSLTIGSAVMSEADLEKLDGITNGTAAASKALVLDANRDIGTIRNLTLDGDLTVDTSTLKVDSTNNRVGIGQASPPKTLTVEFANSNATVASGHALAGGSAGDGLLIENTDSTTDSYANLDFRASSADGRIAMTYNGTTNHGDMHFVTDGGSSASAMILKSTKEVIMPLQPAFMAKLSSDQTNIATTTNTALQFATERFDQGSNYNHSTYMYSTRYWKIFIKHRNVLEFS